MMFLNFLRDLFKGVNNVHWDLGRIMSFMALLPLFAGTAWNMWISQPIDLMALGGGIAAVVTASAALIAAKDIARAQTIMAENQQPPGSGDVNVSVTQ